MLPLTRSRNRARFFGIPFSPSKLFAAGEQGFFYDPSDLSTLFTTSAGTTPVTGVEQLVGLMLDKSKGLVLGPELATNANFDTNVTGWTGSNATIAWSAGSMQVTNTVGAAGFSGYQAFNVTAGKLYRLETKGRVVSGTSTVFQIAFRNTADAATSTFLGGFNVNNPVTGVTYEGSAYYYATSTTTVYLHCRGFPSGSFPVIDFEFASVKELPGNHAFQTNGIAKPTLSARVNLLTKTEQFDDGAWIKFNSTVTQNAAVAPNGTTTAEKLIPNNGATTGFIYSPNASPVVGAQYVASVYVKAAELGFAFVVCNVRASSSTGVCINLATGALTNQGANGTYTVVDAENGWWQVTATATATSANGYLEVWPLAVAGGNSSYTGDGTSGLYIWGADLRATNDGVGIPAYQRVNTATDYDTSGFPLYLRFGGTQAMSTGSIDFTATDKVAVFAGVRKLSDASGFPILCELGVRSVNGSFGISSTFAPNTSTYNFVVQGTSIASYVASTFAAPQTNVLSMAADISGSGIANELFPRVNGSIPTLAVDGASNNAGTGNFGNYPLYVGARNLASAFLNGRIYSLIGVGSAVSAGNISATESWVNGRTKAY